MLVSVYTKGKPADKVTENSLSVRQFSDTGFRIINEDTGEILKEYNLYEYAPHNLHFANTVAMRLSRELFV